MTTRSDFTAFTPEGRIASLQDALDAETAGCGLIVPQWGLNEGLGRVEEAENLRLSLGQNQ